MHVYLLNKKKTNIESRKNLTEIRLTIYEVFLKWSQNGPKMVPPPHSPSPAR